MHDVQIDRAHAGIIVCVKLRNARAVLPLPRELHADKVDELKGIAAAKACIRHGRNHIALFAPAGKRCCVVIDHAAYAVHNRQKGIAELSYFHLGSFTPFE